MKMNFALSALTLAAFVAAGLSTAAFAGRGDDMGPLLELNFDALDGDKDGKLTRAEIDASHAARTKAADTNADGKLSAEELAAMQIKAMTERVTVRAAKMIGKLDTDGDKLLTDAELAASKDRGDMFARIDTDGDGAIIKAEAETARVRMKERGHRRGGKHGRGDNQDGSDN